MEELVINPDEKALETGQFSRHQANVASFEPPQLANVARQGRLYLLAEGLSGAASGAAAAGYATQKVLHTFFTSTLTDPQERLLDAVNQANSDIFERNQLHPARRPMAATVTAALIHNSRLLVANVGDSRAYVVWDQDIEQLTAENAPNKKDEDSPEQVIDPKAEPASASLPPDSFTANQPLGLGLEKEPQIDVFARRLFAGDIVVLVSGGLTGYVEPKEIARAVNLHPPDESIRRLIGLATERGYYDQCAISIIHVLSDPIGKQPPKQAGLPLAPRWSDVIKPPKSVEKSKPTETRPMSGSPPTTEKPKFTRPPDFMPTSSGRTLSPRSVAILSIVAVLLLCTGLYVVARSLLPAEMLASIPMADSMGLLPDNGDEQPQISRLPSPTPDVTSTSTAAPAVQVTLVSESVGSSPAATPTRSSTLTTPVSAAEDTVPPVTPTPTATSLPLPTIELPPGCENRGRFVRDITIPDGTQLAPGEQFDKAWRVNNADTCPWGPGYTLRLLEGNSMSAANIIPLTIIVPPEEDGEIRVSLTAPQQPGDYTASWQLHDQTGEPFGPELFLEIEVTPAVLAQNDAQLNILYDFVTNAGEAEWTSAETGYMVVRSPISDTMELPRPEGLVAVGPAQLRGNLESQGDALLTYPHMENGSIEGSYRVDTPLQPTDTFAAEIGFTKLSILSDDGVTFEAVFTPDGGEAITLFSSPVDYRESPVTEIHPLTGIEPGSTGTITLRVIGGDSLSQDWALWINARLIRP